VRFPPHSGIIFDPQKTNPNPTVTLDLLNPKSITFDRLSSTTILCQVSSHSNQGFSFYRANIPTHSHTHRDSDRYISAPPYNVVDADNEALEQFWCFFSPSFAMRSESIWCLSWNFINLSLMLQAVFVQHFQSYAATEKEEEFVACGLKTFANFFAVIDDKNTISEISSDLPSISRALMLLLSHAQFRSDITVNWKLWGQLQSPSYCRTSDKNWRGSFCWADTRYFVMRIKMRSWVNSTYAWI